MRFIDTFKLVLIITALCASSNADESDELNADVVVYTATASGGTASVAAARQGKSVILIEPGSHVGGMLSGGLGHSDVLGQEDVIGGLAAEVYRRIAEHYGKTNVKDAFDFEPHVAEAVLREMLEEAGVQVVFGEHIQSVQETEGRLKSVTTHKGRVISGKVFIDAGYEGDLMALADVSYAVGREGREKYGESLAGRTELLPGHHQFNARVLAHHNGELLPRLTPQTELVPTGEGDGKFQAYCFRLCLTDRPENRIPIAKPDHYDPNEYELLSRYFRSAGKSARNVLGLARLPNGKCDLNSVGPVSLNLLGVSWEYPEATRQRRSEIWDEHLRWAHGFMWFLQNDPSVPDSQRKKIKNWGLCKDEFNDTGGWPHQLYIREGRRMIGDYVVTQHDLMTNRTKPDSIGMGGYNIDIREVQWAAIRVFRFPKATDEVFMEGYISQPVEPWQIPYRAITPKASECTNLLVPVCTSMSTIAFASFRMEPGYMISGHASGVAASLAIDGKTSVQTIDVTDLQKILRVEKQVLADRNPADE